MNALDENVDLSQVQAAQAAARKIFAPTMANALTVAATIAVGTLIAIAISLFVAVRAMRHEKAERARQKQWRRDNPPEGV